jgi:hypothetical protein
MVLTRWGSAVVPLFNVMVTGPLLPTHVNWKGTPVTIPDQEPSVKMKLLAALTMAPHSRKMMKSFMESLAQSSTEELWGKKNDG